MGSACLYGTIRTITSSHNTTMVVHAFVLNVHALLQGDSLQYSGQEFETSMLADFILFLFFKNILTRKGTRNIN